MSRIALLMNQNLVKTQYEKNQQLTREIESLKKKIEELQEQLCDMQDALEEISIKHVPAMEAST